MYLGCIGQLPDRVLGHDDQTERRDQLVDAVVDLRVNVIRTACNNGNVKVVLVRVADGALTLDANVNVVFVLRQIRLLDSGDDPAFS